MKRRPRWIGFSRPYLSWSWGKQWLECRVRLAEDVARAMRRRVWTAKRRGWLLLRRDRDRRRLTNPPKTPVRFGPPEEWIP